MSSQYPFRGEQRHAALRYCLGLVLSLALFAVHDAMGGAPEGHNSTSSAQSVAVQHDVAEFDTTAQLTAVPAAEHEDSSAMAKHCGLLAACLSALAAAAIIGWARYVKIRRRVMAKYPRAIKVVLAQFRPPRLVTPSLFSLSILRC